MNDVYASPRITGEFLDCSMPMTFDQYSNCGYNCLYCFSTFQRGVGAGSKEYWLKQVKKVDIPKFKKLFLEHKNKSFGKIIEARIPLQWGGLSDPFCTLEEEFGVGYEILQFLNEIEYPTRFSSKTDLFLRNEKYFDLIKQKPHLWYYMSSIITTDEAKAAKIEGGVPSPRRRFENLKKLSEAGIYTAWRFRPFIIGLSDKSIDEGFAMASWAGCKAVSTEFFCLEQRITNNLLQKYKDMSEVIGFNVFKFYKLASQGSGYSRLNYELKRKYIDRMTTLADKYDMRFYCSDADHKEKSMGGSCCGLPMENPLFGKYNKCQFTEALQIAKQSPDKTVKWNDIAKLDTFLDSVMWDKAEGLNTASTIKRGKNKNLTLLGYMKNAWNDTKSGTGLYKYFGGIMQPVGKDEQGNLIFKLDEAKSAMPAKCMGCAGCGAFVGKYVS